MTPAPRWTSEQLEAMRMEAIACFRAQRLTEPLEIYLHEFERYQQAAENLLAQTLDLAQLAEQGRPLLADPLFREALRYLTGPPISEDDWQVVAESPSRGAMRDDDVRRRLMQVILDGHDRRRFPWLGEGRVAEDEERRAAVLATAAMMAARRTETLRRSQGRDDQEERVAQALLAVGLTLVPARAVTRFADAPAPGSFCRESLFGNRKADFLVGLGDRRILALECKVSNSYTNSIKRLNNDAAQKAVVWVEDFGALNVVPAAVLSGVFKLRNLDDAQQRGLALFWSHDLATLTAWIAACGPAAG